MILNNTVQCPSSYTLWALWSFLWCFSLHAVFASFLTRLSMSNMLIISTITKTMARIGASRAATGSDLCKRIPPSRTQTRPRIAISWDNMLPNGSHSNSRRMLTISPIAININGNEIERDKESEWARRHAPWSSLNIIYIVFIIIYIYHIIPTACIVLYRIMTLIIK